VYSLRKRDLHMLEEIRPNTFLASNAEPSVQSFQYTIQQFRFLPESYLASVGGELDPGLDQLVYLRTFIEEETEDAF
jgi:hypothetical protein